MSCFEIAAEARYVTETGPVTTDRLWQMVVAPLTTRHTSWHPSFSDFRPAAFDPDGRPVEFEVIGAAGGRYPIRVETWDDARRLLRLWRGPSKNPPQGSRETFVGLIYQFHVIDAMGVPTIDIRYRETWLTQRPLMQRIAMFVTRAQPSFENGPQRELRWIFERFPSPGKLDYVRPCKPSALDAAP